MLEKGLKLVSNTFKELLKHYGSNLTLINTGKATYHLLKRYLPLAHGKTHMTRQVFVSEWRPHGLNAWKTTLMTS